MLGITQLLTEADDITSEQLLHTLVDVLVFMTNDAHQLANDLGICLAIESVIGWTGVTKDLDERTMNCSTPRAVCPEQRAVDVE